MRTPWLRRQVISVLPILNILYLQNTSAYAAPLSQMTMVYNWEGVGILSFLQSQNVTTYF